MDTIRAWHEAGHFIHITSHRTVDAHGATAQWLERIGLPYDELYCSWDKVARCREIGIELLIDDSPVNLLAAVEAGIAAATLEHPWNREICEERGHRLRRRLGGAGAAPGAAAGGHAPMSDAPEGAAGARPTSCARTCPRSSPSARSPTGAARSGSRA